MDTVQGVIFRPTQQVKTDGQARIHFGRAGLSVTYLDELSELHNTSLELNELSDTEDGAVLDCGYIKSHSASLDDPFNPSQFRKCHCLLGSYPTPS
ncbi:hypothetical protein F2Q69_00049874 [Brassica cretica]|uniref:Uncharacterized protein n=1 Tax=Brassica cretica TaxID=69181 RepID=A0A8S9Q3E8_BRACR|nr:hypothetical protein F2Q69_00049874 [Brassica cretica]